MNSQFLLTLAPFVRELARLSITRSDSSPPKCGSTVTVLVALRTLKLYHCEAFKNTFYKNQKNKYIHIYTHTHSYTHAYTF